ncbi:hypothetical protein G0U57_014275 [Chelydra serpentina]|uniref:Uncharacterized protein n=1 Tax=Chelydra serpentina TaxID=8475 RepID=A0A8T1T2R8_CHESE|nr:hypothetical protein G0U57_014275 [Chelydra serpentina]
MGPKDDPEAFLLTFEQVASATRWPPKQQATILARYLTGTIQTAYHGLPTIEAQDYGRVKAAVINMLDITPGNGYLPGFRPQIIAQEMKDTCWRWLQTDRHSATEVAK